GDADEQHRGDPGMRSGDDGREVQGGREGAEGAAGFCGGAASCADRDRDVPAFAVVGADVAVEGAAVGVEAAESAVRALEGAEGAWGGDLEEYGEDAACDRQQRAGADRNEEGAAVRDQLAG